MATPAKRLATNVPGPFYVDSTCIDCDTCRWMAPSVFDEADGASRVFAQPGDEATRLAALQALVSCPTGSIGTVERTPFGPVFESLPTRIDGEVYHCGFHHRDSFGAASYLVRRPEGNVLVDSPRHARPLVERLAAMGGIDLLFLTHRDDVADHADFARSFGCRRILHEGDVGHDTREVELRLRGTEPVELAPDLLVIPVPGHTRGSACLLWQERYLFSGDHLAWSHELGHPIAFRGACWYDWDETVASVARLLDHRFEWILPGHGRRYFLPAGEMRAALSRGLAVMETW